MESYFFSFTLFLFTMLMSAYFVYSFESVKKIVRECSIGNHPIFTPLRLAVIAVWMIIVGGVGNYLNDIFYLFSNFHPIGFFLIFILSFTLCCLFFEYILTKGLGVFNAKSRLYTARYKEFAMPFPPLAEKVQALAQSLTTTPLITTEDGLYTEGTLSGITPEENLVFKITLSKPTYFSEFFWNENVTPVRVIVTYPHKRFSFFSRKESTDMQILITKNTNKIMLLLTL